MPKRKRPEEDRDTTQARRHKSAKRTDPSQRLEDTVASGVKDLTRGLKQAKGFERQRLGKRLKEAQNGGDADAVARIQTEIETLKSIESRADLAQTHLYKVLLRVKSVRESPLLPADVSLPAKQEEDTKLSNVTSRLFNSKTAKTIVDRTVEEVRRILVANDLNHTKNRRKEEGHSRVSESQDEQMHEDGRVESNLALDESGPDSPQLADGQDSSFSESEEEIFADRIASPDDDDDTQLADRKEFSHALRRSLSRSHSFSPAPSVSSVLSTAQASSAFTKPRAATSNFIPSLSMGGYLSGSDSEAEDLEELGPPRKNRRGQRARQQIWQKKHGANAKHLQKENKDRNAGWDAKRGAQAAGEKRRPGQPWRKEKPLGVASGANEILVKPRKAPSKKANDGPLHPSWEAKKRAKEKQAQQVEFTGKKITFD